MSHKEQHIESIRALSDYIPDAVLITDFNGLIVSANTYAAKVFGFSREEFLGAKIESLLPERYREVHVHHRTTYYKTLPVRPMGSGIDLMGLRKDGTEFPAEISLSPLATEDGTFVISVIRDVTERKHLEEAIRESEERYRSLVELSPEAIIVHQRGLILYVNDAAVRLMMASGTPALIGRSIFDFVPAEYREVVSRRMADLAETGERQDPLLIRSRRMDGHEVYLEVVAGRVSYRGQPAGQVILRDITDRVRSENELRQSREQLRSLSGYLQTAREDERASVAREIHDELGGALTALKLDLASLEDDISDQFRAKAQKTLVAKIESMSALIDTTMQTVRRMATELRPVLLDSLGLIPAIEWQAEEFQKRTGIVCTVTITGGEVEIDRDRSTALFRILQETLTNVARHSDATTVAVEVEHDPRTVRLSIRDNGRGIAESHLVDGKSFGLLGMRERALLYGGDLVIEGRQDQGTRVSVSMPLKPQSA